MANDALKRLQLAVAHKLRSDSWFDNIPIYAVRSKSTEEVVAQALSGAAKRNGKAGIAIQVLIPTLANAAPVPSGRTTVASVVVRVQEIPTVNWGSTGAELSSEDAAMRALQVLHLWNHDGGSGILQADPTIPVEPTIDFDPRLTYDVRLVQVMELANLTRCSPVTFTVGATVALASSTSGATIWYSTDADIFPSFEAGTLYQAAFATPAAGTVIYAAAYKAGLQGSNVTKTTVSA
jgi:hypothetical protein